jgi:hypothetical protein
MEHTEPVVRISTTVSEATELGRRELLLQHKLSAYRISAFDFRTYFLQTIVGASRFCFGFCTNNCLHVAFLLLILHNHLHVAYKNINSPITSPPPLFIFQQILIHNIIIDFAFHPRFRKRSTLQMHGIDIKITHFIKQ